MKFPEKYRYKQGNGLLPPTKDGDPYGLFYIPQKKGAPLKVIAHKSFERSEKTDGGWSHVSVSLPNRCPTWEEMCRVKDLFFDENEVAIQFHPRKENYVNIHPYCLHIFQPPFEIPMPPQYLV